MCKHNLLIFESTFRFFLVWFWASRAAEISLKSSKTAHNWDEMFLFCVFCLRENALHEQSLSMAQRDITQKLFPFGAVKIRQHNKSEKKLFFPSLFSRPATRASLLFSALWLFTLDTVNCSRRDPFCLSSHITCHHILSKHKRTRRQKHEADAEVDLITPEGRMRIDVNIICLFMNNYITSPRRRMP